MIPILTQFVILLLTGFALFHLWRANRSSDRLINIVIAGGFLARAVVGQLMFWISYAELDLGRRFQMGDGLWFFARDALEYFPVATRLANSGVRAIIDYPTGGASVAFVKVLATSVLLLGGVTSVAVLLNLFCYLGMTAIIVRWSEREPRARSAAAFAICAISLSPAFFLWSMQPLKDTFFQFVVIAFIGACAAWQRAWASPRPRLRALLVIGVTMLITLMAIAGVRWYFAFGLFLAAIIFLLLAASISRERKSVSFSATTIMIVFLSRAFLLGGGPYVPTTIISVLTLSTAFAEARRLPSQIMLFIEMTRDGFEKAGGRTSIRAGGRMSKLDQVLGNPPAANEPERTHSAPSSPILKEGMDSGKAVVTAAPPQAIPPKETPPVQVPKAPPVQVPKTPPVQVSKTPPVQVSKAAPVQVSKTSPVQVSKTPPVQVSKAPPVQVSKTPPVQVPKAPPVQVSKTPVQDLKTPPAAPSTTAAVVTPRTVAPAPPAKVVRHSPQKTTLPSHAVSRVLTGMASVVVPRSVGERFGLFHIGGGQGMFWFTELDTLIFDLIFLVAVSTLAIQRAVSWRNPLVWFLVLVTVLAGVPLAYAITNYGTLFRLREMIYIGLALIPLALATSSRRDEVVVAPDASPVS